MENILQRRRGQAIEEKSAQTSASRPRHERKLYFLLDPDDLLRLQGSRDGNAGQKRTIAKKNVDQCCAADQAVAEKSAQISASRPQDERKLYHMLDRDDLLRLQGSREEYEDEECRTDRESADQSCTDKVIEALLRAASEGHVGTVRDLAETGVDLDAIDRYEQTALMKAAVEGHAAVVRFLTEIGADLDNRDAAGFTALLWAAFQGHIEVVSFLAEHGADLNICGRFGQSALMMSVSGGHDEVAHYLFQSGAD